MTPGRYCLPLPDGEDVAFFAVDRRGHVDRLFGAPGSWRRQRLASHPAAVVRWAVEHDAYRDDVCGDDLRGPAAAGRRYARLHVRCWRCDSDLSNAESRRLGLGPECRRRVERPEPTDTTTPGARS